MHKIGDNLTGVNHRIQGAALHALRDPSSIRLLAVSKTRSADEIRQAYKEGQRRFGENYLQEALDKQSHLIDLPLEWHFIGPIQSNKTRAIAEHFDWVHSVDRLRIARRLNDQRPEEKGPLQICLQMNVDNEASKSGVVVAELEELALAVTELTQLRLRGLMAIPAPRTDPAAQQRVFQSVASALEHLRGRYTHRKEAQIPPLDTLSMGMSNDLEAAIAAGATIVRVGTDIFGPRQPRTGI